MNSLTGLTNEKNIQILPQVLIYLHTKTGCKSHRNSGFKNMQHQLPMLTSKHIVNDYVKHVVLLMVKEHAANK